MRKKKKRFCLSLSGEGEKEEGGGWFTRVCGLVAIVCFELSEVVTGFGNEFNSNVGDFVAFDNDERLQLGTSLGQWLHGIIANQQSLRVELFQVVATFRENSNSVIRDVLAVPQNEALQIEARLGQILQSFVSDLIAGPQIEGFERFSAWILGNGLEESIGDVLAFGDVQRLEVVAMSDDSLHASVGDSAAVVQTDLLQLWAGLAEELEGLIGDFHAIVEDNVLQFQAGGSQFHDTCVGDSPAKVEIDFLQLWKSVGDELQSLVVDFHQSAQVELTNLRATGDGLECLRREGVGVLEIQDLELRASLADFGPGFVAESLAAEQVEFFQLVKLGQVSQSIVGDLLEIVQVE